MKIRQWNNGVMVLVTKQETITIIRNPSEQIETGDCNHNHVEFSFDGNKEFSISVTERKEILSEDDIDEFGHYNRYGCCNLCGNDIEDCYCGDTESDCLVCGLDPETCGCWNKCEDEFNKELIIDTFRSMSENERARWLKTKGKL